MSGTAMGTGINGVYALGMPDKPTPAAVAKNPYVDGLTLQFLWDAVEPQEGHFNWSMIDEQIGLASANHKMVSLAVTPGIFSPAWIYTAGAAQFTFTWDKPWGPAPCSKVAIPIPWDAVYLSKWEAFVRSLGERYGANPTVSMVRIEGINAQTSELLLPHSGGQDNSPRLVRCPFSDDLRNWQTVGYTRSKVVSTWEAIASVYAQAFPNQNLVLEAGPWGMPPIDDAGNIMPGRATDTSVIPALISYGIGRFGNRFVVQNSGLNAIWNWPAMNQIGLQTPTGFQMAWNVTNDTQCRMNHFQKPCDPRQMLASAVNRGINAHASYLEIYIPDLLNPTLQGVIADAHSRLASASGQNAD